MDTYFLLKDLDISLKTLVRNKASFYELERIKCDLDTRIPQSTFHISHCRHTPQGIALLIGVMTTLITHRH
jgi:hypothetical protein